MANLGYIGAEANLQHVTLTSDYTAADGHMHLTAGHGARLKAISGSDFRFWIRTVLGTLLVFEVTARSTDDLTVSCVTGYGADANLAAGTELAFTMVHEALEQLRADLLPTRVTMWHDESTVTAGNAIANVVDTGSRYCTYSNQNTAADGDTFTQSFLLAAGTYSLCVLGSTFTSRGKIDWYIDDVKVVSLQDWYAASLGINTIKTVGSIAVVGNGRHVLKGVINGKHASSSSYFMLLQKMWFYPATDVKSV